MAKRKQKKGYRYQLAVNRYREKSNRHWYQLFQEFLQLLKKP